MDPLLTHIGDRIRMYRKTNGWTMDELAQKVFRTKASICKYESGQVSIDISTLFDIAAALHISPYQLIDYTPPARDGKEPTAEHGFTQYNRLYLYHMNQKTIYFSVLIPGPYDEAGQRATLFYKVNETEKFQDCDCIYHGYLYNYDTVLNCVFRNYHNPVENILLNFTVPMRKTSMLTGMISGLDANTLVPTSRKIVLSCEPLDTHSDELRQILTITSETFKQMKTANTLFVPLESAEIS
jgi:transcriptional regulator with XRE-family HTH domain